MLSTVFHGTKQVSYDSVPDTHLQHPTDAVVRVTTSCVCGSDLWYYRGESPREHGQRMGHEFVGVVEQIGSEVANLSVGALVLAPFRYSDGTCPHCRHGYPSACVNGGIWGQPDADGAQGQYVRVPYADAVLVPVDGVGPDDPLVPDLLALTDVMSTGYHAAVSAGVTPGSRVVVVGDGAVGLCGVIAARLLGAEQVLVMSRHPQRQRLALELGATRVAAERGDQAQEYVTDWTDGVGADAVLECVGTGEALRTAVRATRPGGSVGLVGVPHGDWSPLAEMFVRNVGVRGGLAPARTYMPELLPHVLDRTITPGRVFDRQLPVEDVALAYELMDTRQAVKVLLSVS